MQGTMPGKCKANSPKLKEGNPSPLKPSLPLQRERRGFEAPTSRKTVKCYRLAELEVTKGWEASTKNYCSSWSTKARLT